MDSIKILRKPEVEEITGLSRTTMYERTKIGLFPEPISLGGRAVGYLEHEVQTVIVLLAAGRDNETIKRAVALMKENREKMASSFMKSLVGL